MTPAEIAFTHRFPIGSVVTVNGETTKIESFLSNESGLNFVCHTGTHHVLFIKENEPREFNILHGFDSEENSVVAEDYPYGRFRTKCRWWIETATKGSQSGNQRMMQQTLNPKNNLWNKPHASVYSDIRLLYVDDKGHVHGYGLNLFTGPTWLHNFVETGLFAQLNEQELKRMGMVVKSARRFAPKTWKDYDTMLQLAREDSNTVEQRATELGVDFSPSDVERAVVLANAEKKFGKKFEM